MRGTTQLNFHALHIYRVYTWKGYANLEAIGENSVKPRELRARFIKRFFSPIGIGLHEVLSTESIIVATVITEHEKKIIF